MAEVLKQFGMKRILLLFILCINAACIYAQFTGTDSLRNYNNKYITNNPATAFTNLRLNTLLRGIIDWVDTARAGTGGGGVIGVDTLYALNDTTIRYRKNGVFRNVIIKGVYDYRRKVDTLYKVNDTTIGFKINGQAKTLVFPGGVSQNLSNASLTANGDYVQDWANHWFFLNNLKSWEINQNLPDPNLINNTKVFRFYVDSTYNSTALQLAWGLKDQSNSATDSLHFEFNSNKDYTYLTHWVAKQQKYVEVDLLPYLSDPTVNIVTASATKNGMYQFGAGFGSLQPQDSLQIKAVSATTAPKILGFRSISGDVGTIVYMDAPTGSATLSNVGSGYRLVKTAGGQVKTVFGGYGILPDSSSNTDAITFKADTSSTNHLVTQSDLNDTAAAIRASASSIDTTNKWISDIRRRPGTDTVEKFKNGSWQFAYLDSTKDRTVSKGCILGNSTIADYVAESGIHRFLMTPADSAVGTTITNLAIPGNTIHQQDSVWLADPNNGTYDWIIVEIALNDLIYTESAATALARLQTLIDDINAHKKSGAKVLISTMTPCKQRLIDLYGSTNGLISYQKWLDMNNAISGGLPGKITGVDYRIKNHTAALNDGSDNLAPAYDLGDHVHETNEARSIIASFWRGALNELGFLKVTQPQYFKTNVFYQSGNSILPYNTSASLFLGQRVNATVARPINLNLGGTAGATAGNPWNCKLITFDGGFGDSTLIAGVGVSSGRQEYHVLSGGVHSFYIAGISETANEKMQIGETATGEGKLTLRAIAGGYGTATPAVIDMGGSVANAFGDPSKCKMFLFNNGGVYAGLGHAFNGTSSQFELHTTSSSSFHHYINSIDKFIVTDTSLVAPDLQTTTDTTTFKPLVQNSSGYIKRMTNWPTGGSGITSINSKTGPAITLSGGVATYVTNPGGGNTLAYNVDPTSLVFKHALDAQYTDANNTGTSQTDLYTKSVAGLILGADGARLHFKASGITNDATATVNLQAIFAGNSIGGTGALTISATGNWTIEGDIIRTSSTTARTSVTISVDNAAKDSYKTTSVLTGLDFTTANILKITGQAGGGGGGSNDITAQMWYIDYSPAP